MSAVDQDYRDPPLRCVVVAHSANPHTGASVPMIGHRISSQLGKLTDATFVFHARHREDLDGAFPIDRVMYAGSSRLANALRRFSSRLFPNGGAPVAIIEFLDYLLFDLDAYRQIRRALRRSEFDFVLRVNPVSYQYASILAWLPAPVFTGPHNSGMNWPPGFAFLKRQRETLDRLRFSGPVMHALYKDTGRYAGIFVANELCARTVGRKYQDRVLFCSETGVEGLQEQSPHAGDARRLLYVGRLVPFKAVDTLIRALARLPATVHLTVVGDGAQRPQLEALARDLSVHERCLFVGWQPEAELARYYADAGVFVFPSVRESAGTVVLQAMSHGLPCVVANWAGPAAFTEGVGCQLSVESPQALENHMVSTLLQMLADPAVGHRMGVSSREVIGGQYVWERKAELLLEAISRRLASVSPP